MIQRFLFSVFLALPTLLFAPGVRAAPFPSPADTLRLEELMRGPVSTPYDTRPHARDPGQVLDEIDDAYPGELREAGVGGTAVLHVLIDERGRVRKTRVARGSGRTALDAAAREVMAGTRFMPARLEGEPVPVWVQLPITFGASGDRGRREERRRDAWDEYHDLLRERGRLLRSLERWTERYRRELRQLRREEESYREEAERQGELAAALGRAQRDLLEDEAGELEDELDRQRRRVERQADDVEEQREQVREVLEKLREAGNELASVEERIDGG